MCSAGMVCLLQRSIYGLKQSARYWHQRLMEFLLGIGFKRLISDPCVCVHEASGIILAVWVDDILLFSVKSQKRKLDEIKSKLNSKFKIRDLGEVSHFLGIEIKRNRKEKLLWISQSSYFTSVLQRSQMQDSKPISTPIATGTKLAKYLEGEDTLTDVTEYQQLVGYLMYGMLATRPDLAFPIALTSQYCAQPTATHLNVIK